MPIRPYRASDSAAALDIWLRASIQAHDFVAATFWQEQLGVMRDHYLPQAETLLLEENAKPLAFLSLHEDHLAALFVAPEEQGRGIGRKLLEAAMQQRTQLKLTVYKANDRAVAFYQTAGFTISGEQSDPHTGQPELTMHWSAGDQA